MAAAPPICVLSVALFFFVLRAYRHTTRQRQTIFSISHHGSATCQCSSNFIHLSLLEFTTTYMMYTKAPKAKLTNDPYHFKINAIYSRASAYNANLVYYKSKLSQAIIIVVVVVCVCKWVRLYRIVIH